MRWLVLAAAAISLSGCGLPTIVSVWSTALDFASYGSSGKTVTDHGISLVLQKDCALMRGLDGPVCTEKGAPNATRKPPRDVDTPASRRVVYLQEEANRGTARYPVDPDQNCSKRSTLAETGFGGSAGLKLVANGEVALCSAFDGLL